MATANWRTINVDLYDPESASNFDASSLIPSSAAHNGATTIAPVSIQEIQQLAAQIRQLLRGGDTEGALRGALENAPYGGEGVVKVCSILSYCDSPRVLRCVLFLPLFI